MLRRNQQLRRQLNQVQDAGLFCLALWLAYEARMGWYRCFPATSVPIQEFAEYRWLWLVLLPGAPLFLEMAGFYKRPVISGRRQTAWLLFKGCASMTAALILLTFLLKMGLSRTVILVHGLASFALVFLHTEALRLFYRSRLGREQYRDRYVLIGTREDTRQLRCELGRGGDDGVDFVAELEVRECTLDRLTGLLHEHAVNGVIISARHTALGEVEEVVRICELEGVEAWLMAEFFKTTIYRRHFHEFRGKPVLVFQPVRRPPGSG